MAYIVEQQLSLFDSPKLEGITSEEINRILSRGPGFSRGKLKVWRFYREKHTKPERISFIKGEWGTGGQCPAYVTENREDELMVDYSPDGFRIVRINNHNENINLSWAQADSRIMDMVASDTFMTEEDLKCPCVNCIFEKDGYCKHIEGDSWWCERWHKDGCFQIPRDWKCRCGRTPKLEEIQQDEMGPDSYHCRCGVVTIFNNQGTRPSAFDLWKRGEIIGE